MKLETDHSYEAVSAGSILWEVDGRGARPENLHYREVWQVPQTADPARVIEVFTSNRPGLIRNDPIRGFDLTMHPGDTILGSYTTRDFNSAPFLVDYRPHYQDWRRDPTSHPNLVFPGRSVVWRGVRFDALGLGDDVLGTGGVCVQEWSGLEADALTRTKKVKKTYTAAGVCFVNPRSQIGRISRFAARFSPKPPFAVSRRGVAPLYVAMTRLTSWYKATVLHVDPDIVHELTFHWTPDGRAYEWWFDGELVLRAREGERALPAGPQPLARVRIAASGLPPDCWHDNADGSFRVRGAAGHTERDQVYSVERMSIVATR